MVSVMSKLDDYLSKRSIVVSFGLVLILGTILRFYFFPYDIPIVTDGFYSFVYAVKTVYEGGLPTNYGVTNTGWANFLSLFFIFLDKSDPLFLMSTQRIVSITVSIITAVPAYFIFRKFASVRWSLFGVFLLTIEPRLLLISLEGINYSLFFFLFILTIALFLKKTNLSFFLSFICIACAALVRYEGLLLIIPLSIMYFIKFRNKKSIYRYVAMIFVLIIILVPVATLRMQATENICTESMLGKICGQDGMVQNILSGIAVVERTAISEIPNVEDPTLYKTDKSVLEQFLFLGLSNLIKFLAYSLFPIFVVLIVFWLCVFIYRKKFPNLNFYNTTILFVSFIMLLPPIYAYGRGIEEIRYVLFIIPALCIMSISWKKLTTHKIFESKIIFVILILLSLVLSIAFIEHNKRDYIHDIESFKISQEVIKRTSVFNSFNQSGYIKAALLFNEWPELLEPNIESGKLESELVRVPIRDYENIEQFVVKSKDNGLQYIVVDDNRFFKELRENPKKYPYLTIIFDSESHGYVNHFEIYKIDYGLIDVNE